MYIYKITNLINQKIYIGQSIHPVKERLARHFQDAISERTDTHLARAIRKYGTENFIIEIIDQANTQEELTKKEYYWIEYYNSIKQGYNETNAQYKCGGNTYLGRTKKEMEKTKEKLSASKKGDKNPNSKKVKCYNIITNEEFHFNTLAEMKEFFGETNHNFITRRCNNITKCLYKQVWKIAYEENNYFEMSIEKNNAKSKRILVKNLETQEELEFQSYASAERYFNLPDKYLSSKAYKYKEQKTFIKNKFQITILD